MTEQKRIVLTAKDGAHGGFYLQENGEDVAYRYNSREKKIFLSMADHAKIMAVATGSIGAKLIETVFGVEVEVFWARG